MQINKIMEAWFNKGFKGSKCKTLLKLASSRIKLLRNKREVQLKQLRKELAQLLENGQESKARIRVEHIIREQDISDAYELLEHFCELLIVRVPIMEIRRDCPLDLKEAVASLIFAAPRASDLPELLELQTLFSFKYGREFVASATELRPNCGVNRMIIENLSARAPAARAKLDLMLEIAEEFNVDWDPAETEQEFSNIPEDLMDGQSKFIGPIQMLPIPSREDNSHSQKSSPNSSKAEESVLSVSNADMKAVDPNEEPQFVPFVAPSSGPLLEAEPNRFYSPPRESSINQQSGLMEETLLEKSHSRTRSEGSMNLQDIIEAAESAAENAEKAAQAAREAAELCRSQFSAKSKCTSHEKDILQSSNPDISLQAGLKSGLSVDDYDWTQVYDGRRQENGAFQSEKPDNNTTVNTLTQFTPDDYDWSVETYTRKQREEFPFSSSEYTPVKVQPEAYIFFHGEVNDQQAFRARDEGGDSLSQGKSIAKGHVSHSHNSHGAPHFDGTENDRISEPFVRQSSLEDDPYYTYPNLFSKSAHG